MGSKSPTIQSQSQNQTQIRIAIIGAGIAGLSLAAALLTKNKHPQSKPKFKIQIYESLPHQTDKGAGLALHANALGAMSLLGPSIRSAYLDAAVSMTSPPTQETEEEEEEEEEEMATQVILAHGPHAGQLVAELGRARGRKSVSRADLLGGFLRLVDSDCVLFGRKLVGVSERDCDDDDDDDDVTGREKIRKVIKLEFQNGETAETDCLIGADGIHSVVRAHLLGRDHPATKPKNRDRWQVYRTLVSAEEARAQIGERWTRAVPILLGPRGHVNCIPMNKGTRVSAGVAVRGAAVSGSRGGGGLGVGGDVDGDDDDRGGRHDGSRPLDPSLYSDYTEDAQRIVRMVAKDTSASWSVGDHDHAPYFHRGRVVMVGDAAHASLPFAGNGAAQALEDAAVLDHLFARVEDVSHIEAALAAFDAVRRPRSQKVVDIARTFGRVYAYAEGNLHEDPQGMRDFFAEAAAFTNEVDLNKQNRDALEIYESILRGDLPHHRAHQ